MPPAIPAVQRVQTYTLDRMATEIPLFYHYENQTLLLPG